MTTEVQSGWLLSLSYNTTTMFKGIKVATVEECDQTTPVRAMNVTTVEEGIKKPGRSDSKRQLLEKMIERCTNEGHK